MSKWDVYIFMDTFGALRTWQSILFFRDREHSRATLMDKCFNLK